MINQIPSFIYIFLCGWNSESVSYVPLDKYNGIIRRYVVKLDTITIEYKRCLRLFSWTQTYYNVIDTGAVSRTSMAAEKSDREPAEMASS